MKKQQKYPILIVYLLGPVIYSFARLNSRNKHNLDVAAKSYRTSLKLGFRPQKSSLKLAYVTLSQRKWSEAKKLLESHYKKYNDSDSSIPLADCHISLGEYAAAVRLMQKTLQDNPDNIHALSKLAKAYKSQNKILEYSETVDKLAMLDTTERRRLRSCIAKASAGRYDEAKDALESILDDSSILQITKLSTCIEVAQAFCSSYHYDHAISIHKFIQELGYSSVRSINHLGSIYERCRKYRDATNTYKYAIETYANHAWWFQYHLGRSLLLQERHRESCEAFAKHYGDRKYYLYEAEIANVLLPEAANIPVAFKLQDDKEYRKAAELFSSVRVGWDNSTLLSDPSLNIDNTEMLSNNTDLSQRNISKRIDKLLDARCISFAEYLIFKEIGCSKDPKELIKKLAQIRKHHGARNARHRINSIAVQSYSSYKKISNKFDIAIPASDYRLMILSNREMGDYDTAFSLADEALEIYPESIALHKETAILYSKNRNVYESKRIWLEIAKKWHHRLKPNDYTRITSTLLTTHDLETHDLYIEEAKMMFGDSQALLYNEFHSLFSKITNRSTEEHIFGFGDHYDRYSEKDLIRDCSLVAKKLEEHTFNDEQTHKIMRRSSLIRLIAMEESFNEEPGSINTLLLKSAPYTHKLPKKTMDSLSKSITSSRNNVADTDYLNKLLENEPTDTFSYIEWLLMFDLLSYNKLLVSGLIAREKAIKALLLLPTTGYKVTPYLIHRKIHALLETEQFEEAGLLHMQLESYFPDQPKNKELATLINIQTRSKTKIRTTPTERQGEAEKAFKALISGKKVAIVGPAHNEINAGKEIDSYDTVIRFNYRGQDSLPDPVKSGHRIDIAYQNGPNVRAYLANKIPDYLKDDLAIYNVEIILSKSLSEDIKMGDARFNGGRVQLLNYAMMAVPTVVFDVSQYNPKSVKIYNSNFYLSSTPYGKEYTKHNKSNKMHEKTQDKLDIYRLRELIGAHDLISQLRFMRNTYRADNINLDDECLHVINMSDLEYMEQMQDIFKFTST